VIAHDKAGVLLFNGRPPKASGTSANVAIFMRCVIAYRTLRASSLLSNFVTQKLSRLFPENQILS
jgi:hypothetical protein